MSQCSLCGKAASGKWDVRRLYCDECRVLRHKEVLRKHAVANPGYNARKTREWYAQADNRVRQNTRQRGYDAALKDRVFQAYGGWKCACCDEIERNFLTIDHVNNDGAAHRTLMGEKRGGRKFYQWLVKNGFPGGFQVLCMNCNWGKSRNKGICPHLTQQGSTTISQESTAEAIAAGSAQLPSPLGDEEIAWSAW